MTFREIVSGERRGLGARLARSALAVAETPYAWVVSRRNRRFDSGKLESHRAAVPVICVGNITLGGTGKTPMVRWVARRLLEQDHRVAILSRGYGSKEGRPNDEALELARALPDTPHLQDPDRVASAARATREFGAEAILLDDGFQHRRLARDLDIVLLDALAPFGHGRVFPRGLLREPLTGLRRAGVVALTRADLVSVEERAAIQNSAREFAPDAIWCEVAHAPTSLIQMGAGDSRQALDSIHGVPVAAFCGIGNPAGFRETLNSIGADVAAWREFPDHHAYSKRDVEELSASAKASGAEVAVCTMKDLVKLDVVGLGETPLRAIEIEIAFLHGEEALRDAIERVVP